MSEEQKGKHGESAESWLERQAKIQQEREAAKPAPKKRSRRPLGLAVENPRPAHQWTEEERLAGKKRFAETLAAANDKAIGVIPQNPRAVGDPAPIQAAQIEQPTALIESNTAIVVAQQRAEPGLALVSVFERLAKDPAVDVAKLRELIDLQKSILDREAEAAFWVDFVAMQPELPRITKDGQIIVKEKLQSRYSTNEAIQAAVRPILARFRFGLSFRHEFRPDADASGAAKWGGWDTTIGVLAHSQGHQERDTFMARADNSGNKNDIQALGSSRSYGERYTTRSLLNIISEGQDDDGAASGRLGVIDPEGFEPWKAALEGVAGSGTPELEAAWAKSDPKFKSHLVNHYRAEWIKMKAGAALADRS